MPTKKGGLGKGLASLIPTGTQYLGEEATEVLMGTQQHVAYYQEIPIGEIQPNPQQPRKYFDNEPMDELIASIKNVGLLQPIVVRKVSRETPYEIIMGERRWRASKVAGLVKIPAIIRQTKDDNILRDALLENLHRAELNPLEEAAAYQQLLDDFQLTHEDLAQKIGRSRPKITNTLRLLKLPPYVQTKIADGSITAGHARVLVTVPQSRLQEEIADTITKKELSVRETEKLCTNLTKTQYPSPKDETTNASSYLDQETFLEEKLSTEVKIKKGKKKGMISIIFSNEDDLNRILQIISL